MSLAEYPDPLAAQEKCETFVDCRECGHHWRIIVKESVTVGELESYICPDCRPPLHMMKVSPEEFNGFDTFKETFIK